MTRTEAVAMSRKKWEDIIAGASGGGGCGLCEYFDPDDDSYECEECPLFPDICSNDRPLANEDYPLYWRWRLAKDQVLAKQMLDAINTRGQQWIEEE